MEPAGETISILHVHPIIKLPIRELAEALGDERVKLYITPGLCGISEPVLPAPDEEKREYW